MARGYHRQRSALRTAVGPTCDRLLAAVELRLGTLPLRLYGAEWTIEAATKDFAEWADTNGYRRRAFFVDSLQTAMSAGCTDSSVRARVGANVAALTKAAAQYRLAMIATGEIPRSHYSDRGDDMRAGKENGSIEFAAKVQLVLRRSKQDDSVIRVSVPKIKRGAADEHSFALRFDRRTHTITEVESIERADARPHTDQRRRIVEAIRGAAAPLKSKNSVLDAAKVKRQMGLTLLQSMLQAGELTFIDGSFGVGKEQVAC